MKNMKKQRHISLSIAAVILFALTVCGSIWDFEIANAVYIGQTPAENIFGIIFSYVGILPTFVGWSFLGASIVCLSKKSPLQNYRAPKKGDHFLKARKIAGILCGLREFLTTH